MSAPCPAFGFVAQFEVEPEQSDALWRDFVALLRDRGLEADGRRRERQWAYRIHGESTQASDLDRRAVEDWAASRAEIRSHTIGELHEVTAGS